MRHSEMNDFERDYWHVLDKGTLSELQKFFSELHPDLAKVCANAVHPSGEPALYRVLNAERKKNKPILLLHNGAEPVGVLEYIKKKEEKNGSSGKEFAILEQLFLR